MLAAPSCGSLGLPATATINGASYSKCQSFGGANYCQSSQAPGWDVCPAINGQASPAPDPVLSVTAAKGVSALAPTSASLFTDLAALVHVYHICIMVPLALGSSVQLWLTCSLIMLHMHLLHLAPHYNYLLAAPKSSNAIALAEHRRYLCKQSMPIVCKGVVLCFARNETHKTVTGSFPRHCTSSQLTQHASPWHFCISVI